MVTPSIGNLGGAPLPPAAITGETPRVAAPARAAAPAPASVPTSLPAEQPSREEVQRAVEAIRKSVPTPTAGDLQFSVDDELGRTIVRITDTQTGELIRQIPSEEIVELAKALDRLQGVLLRQQA